MSAAIVYALAAMLLNGLLDFVFKKAAQGPFKTHQFIMVQSVLFGSLMWIYGYLTSQIVFIPAVGWGLAAGICMFTGFYCFALSLQHGSISINAPIFRLSFIVTAVLAIVVLAEPVTSTKVAGLALALMAIWLLLGAQAGKSVTTIAARAAGRHSLILVCISTVALGCGTILHKIGLMNGAPTPMLLAAHASVYFCLATMVSVRADGRVVIPSAAWPYAISGSLIGAGSFITLLNGLALADASIIVPIAQMGFVVSAALGIIVLGEALTVRKIAGLGAAVGALWLLASG